MTILGVAVGVLIVLVVAVGQLGNKGSGKFSDPGIAYPAALLDGTTIGKTDAALTMEVYGDFQCPICGRHSLDVEPTLVAKYVQDGKLRIVHHEIDLLGRGGDESRIPAIGAVCANDQHKYWEYSHWIYNNQAGENIGGFKRERVVQIAVAAGLDEAGFSTCLDSPAAADAVKTITDKATTELGINSTPTIYLNGTQSIGLKSPTQWAAMIDAELAKVNASPAASGSPATSGSPGTPPSTAP